MRNGGEPVNAGQTTSGFTLKDIVFAGLIVVGGVVFVFGADAGQRIWANLLVGSYYLLGLGLGSAVLLAMLFVSGARWSEIIRPVLEKLTILVPVGVLGMAIVLIGAPSLYPWTAGVKDASGFQALWLGRRFFLLRAVVYFALWLGLVFLLVNASRRNDRNRGKVAAMFLVVFAITCWLASVDWIMSLEPKWSSAVFGVYHFAGMFLGALAAVTMVAIWYERRGNLGSQLPPRLLGDLGTLLFSFSNFWMYIWFCQYLLIWYANIPEEAEYFVLRQHAHWQPLLLAVVGLNWVIPFVVLLCHWAKENRGVLLTVAALVLVGRWLDLYVMVLPPVVGDESGFVPSDTGTLVAVTALAALLVCRGPIWQAKPSQV
jgi:hypothetical protein